LFGIAEMTRGEVVEAVGRGNPHFGER